MRTVWFVVFDAALEDVEASLAGAGFERADAEHRWTYPAGELAVLFAYAKPYDSMSSIPEEDEDVRTATGGRTPAVWVGADVSGRVDGDAEVRHLAETIMSRFDALAFDDYTAYAHAWTLGEIRAGATFDGLRYFDCLGYWEREKARQTSHE